MINFELMLEQCFEEAFSDESELDKLLTYQGYNIPEDIDGALIFINQCLNK